MNRRLAVFCLPGPTFNLHRAKMDFIEKIRFNSVHNEAKLPLFLFSVKFEIQPGARHRQLHAFKSKYYSNPKLISTNISRCLKPATRPKNPLKAISKFSNERYASHFYVFNSVVSGLCHHKIVPQIRKTKQPRLFL